MNKTETYYKRKPSLLWMIVFFVPALAGLFGFFTGLYMIFILKEIGIGVFMTMLMGFTALGFGSYVLTSIDAYKNSKNYFLKLEPHAIIISKGKTVIIIPQENLVLVENDAVRVRPNHPVVNWTNIEYREKDHTMVERFANIDYGDHGFAKMIKRRYLEG